MAAAIPRTAPDPYRTRAGELTINFATKTDLINLVVERGRPRRSCWERSGASGWNHTMLVMKP
jgi:hypothetical protein